MRPNRWTMTAALVGVMALAAGLVASRQGGGEREAAARDAVEAPAGPIVGPGRVEPISEEILIGVEVGGRIAAVHVDEGDPIAKGQLLAELENRDYRAQVAAASARIARAEANYRLVVNGARTEERREAAAAVRQAEAELRQAEIERARRESLAAEGVVAREERDRAVRNADVARARLNELVERRNLVEAGAREEDEAAAAAGIAIARATLREAEARLARTRIVAPLDGVVLRKHMNAGESVSPERPDTVILTVADVSRLRVRVEVDEADVGRLRHGQAATVTAAAYGDRRFAGRVVQIGRMLGRKRIRTDAPEERVDTRVLEVLVELEPGVELPIGLRVDATIN